MPDHEIKVEAAPRGLRVTCSCQDIELWTYMGRPIRLNDINELAHEHIETVYPPRTIFGPPTQHVDGETTTLWAGFGEATRGKVTNPRQQVLKPAPTEYVHGLDQPEDDPRRGVLGT